MPALVLIYAGIDIVAWLASRDAAAKSKERFTWWVDHYLLPVKSLRCSSLDLYAGRCAIVHTFTADSDLSDTARAKKIVYAWGDSKADVLNEMIDLAKTSDWVGVRVEDLLEGFRLGVARLLDELGTDAKRAEEIYVKAARFFSSMSNEGAENLLAWGRRLLSDST